jgi:tRNA dimethylallyltransferase
MQLYQGMDIGTAKLTAEERQGVPHHLLDVWDVRVTATAAAYQELCRARIRELQQKEITPILVGGSGLYLRAALDELAFPGTDPELRAVLEAELQEHGPEALHARLASQDPEAAARMEPTNGRRIVRALEVVALQGSMPGQLTSYPMHIATTYLGVDRADLAERVSARVHRMWEQGLVDEVAGLEGLREGVTASKALGYAQALKQLDGELTAEQAQEQTITATRRFVRRQRAWFRRDPRVYWPAEGPDLIKEALKSLPVPPVVTRRKPPHLAMHRSDTSVEHQGMTTTTDRLDANLLEHATTDGSLELLYQPEIDLDSGAIVAMEALLRWRHNTLGILSPAEFLPAAIASGIMPAIDHWVLRAAAAEAESWMSLRGPARHLWVNVSVQQLRAPGFVESVRTAIDDHALPHGVLGLEISEQTILELGDEAEALLLSLRAAGASLAVDDFSSFYATLGAIGALPVDAVKLGHRYVRDVGDEGHDDSFVKTVIDTAHSRGMYVVAEGVETWSESARLTELGCDRAHGWLFASPQRSDKARWLLTQGTGWRGGVVTPDVQGTPFPIPRQHS